MNEILDYARSLYEKLRDIRRELHRHPEEGHREFYTTDLIRRTLSEIPGIELKPLDYPVGVVAELPGTKPELGTVALRCDIDALPISEANTHSYVSETPGWMHACGHDGHVAVNLGAAMILSKFRPERNVRFIFQPAEENEPSGAKIFRDLGVLDGLSAIFGFHLNATSDFGNVGWRDGTVMAGSMRFKVTVTGKSGHTAYPEKCINPITVLAHIWCDLEHAAVLTPSSFISGSEFCPKSPDTAEMTARQCFQSNEDNEELCRKLRETADKYAAEYGAKVDLEMDEGFPITYNDPALGHIIRETAEEFGMPLEEIPSSNGSDDFAYYAQKIPAYYMTFGLRTHKDFPIAHTSIFDFDEKILPESAAVFAKCALKF